MCISPHSLDLNRGPSGALGSRIDCRLLLVKFDLGSAIPFVDVIEEAKILAAVVPSDVLF